MAKLWLDVSSIMVWQRPAVGVIRVEFECARFFLKQYEVFADEVGFCRADGVGGFYEVGSGAVENAIASILGRSIETNPAPAVESNFTAVAVPFEVRVKRRLVRTLEHFPERLRSGLVSWIFINKSDLLRIFQALRLVREGFNLLFHSISNIKFSRKQAASVVSDDPLRSALHHPFSPGDLYFSAGADWNHSDLSNLYEIKKSIDISVVLFCYDLIPIKFPHLTLDYVAEIFPRYYSNMAWVADKVLCISKCSELDMLEFFRAIGAPLPSTTVLRLGDELSEVKASAGLFQGELAVLNGREYILFVSTIERRKNHEVLYRAYLKLLDDGVDSLPLLVFVGMPGWGVSDFIHDVRSDFRVKDSICIFNHVTDDELASLYKNCLFTVYPSLYEGWGLPVAESMGYGKLCIASSRSSIPEIGGGLVKYIEPTSVEGWAQAMKFYSQDKSALFYEEQKIVGSFSATSWEDTAMNIFGACKEVTSRNRRME